MSDHDWEAYYKLKPGDIFVECGAFYGDDVAYTLSRVGRSGGALFIEPNPQACSIIYTMISELNCGMGFRVVNCPVWKINDVVDFYNLGGTTSYIKAIEDRASDPNCGIVQEVQARTIDSLIREYNIPKVDLLVADVEGVEPEVVQGCAESLKAGIIKNMSICIYHMAGTRDRIKGFLGGIGSFEYRESGRNGLPVLHINPKERE